MFVDNPSKTYHLIGCMSGTSLDGIDLAYVKFTKEGDWSFEILASHTHQYSASWRRKLAEAITLSPAEISKLDADYTRFLSRQILDFMDQKKIHPLDAVATHGHTVFHQPNKGLTFQMGNLAELADELGCTVVCDFRVQDVALGGQGAPLVPIGDIYLFKTYQACLNLGGFSNISVKSDPAVLAYDICAVNTVLNALAQRKNRVYDDRGKMARIGKFLPPFYQELEEINHYSKTPPKSLGQEWVNKNVVPIIYKYSQQSTEDLLHTYTHHISDQIVKCLPDQGAVLLSGGGTYNTYLVELLKQKSRAEIVIPPPALIDYKEALIFGFLGLLRLLGSDNCLANVTGARHNHSSGKIFHPKRKSNSDYL